MSKNCFAITQSLGLEEIQTVEMTFELMKTKGQEFHAQGVRVLTLKFFEEHNVIPRILDEN